MHQWREGFEPTVWNETFSDWVMDLVQITVKSKMSIKNGAAPFCFYILCSSLLSDEQLLGAAEPPEGNCCSDIRRAHLSGSDHVRRGSQSVSRKGLRRQTIRRQLNSDGNFYLCIATVATVGWSTVTFKSRPGSKSMFEMFPKLEPT